MIKGTLWFFGLFFCPLILQGQASGETEIFYPTLINRRVSVLSDLHDSPSVISLAAVGDLMMGGRLLPMIHARGSDYPFDSTRIVLQSVDFAFANLEAPFTHTGETFDKTYTFHVPPEYADGVVHAGLDVLTLANNHILDYGPEGLFSTINVLDSLHIAHCGADCNLEKAEKGVIVNKGDWRVGFLAYSMTYPTEFWATSEQCGTAYPYPNRLKQTIQTMKDQTDLVVVAFHWGGELRTEPKAYQRVYAHLAIDCGADLVIGHHPHVLEGLELYKGRLIAYSLGNYVFGSYSPNAKVSMVLQLFFDRLGPLTAKVIPISVYNNDVQFQPKILKGENRENVIQNLNDISADLNGGEEIIRSSGLIIVQ
ncbi:CapA family protein [bacterium]|nr:CapA family protein [bacterium]RQV97463.1 MAG: CapA family protein [bacterium]